VLFSGGGGRGGGGQNAPRGAVVNYVVPEDHDKKTEINIEMLDSAGDVMRAMSSTEAEKRAPNPFAAFFGGGGGAGKLATEKGTNQWRWNLRLRGGIDVRLPEVDAAEAWSQLAQLEREHGLLGRDVVAIDLRLPGRLVIRTAPDAEIGRGLAKAGHNT